MNATVPSTIGGLDGESRTLTTGETVTLPLTTSATLRGVVLGASPERVQELLPTGLTPIRATPTCAAVTFLSVKYHRIGDGEIDPYNEFGILLPAVPESSRTIPFASIFTCGMGGYVWYLPVTTEPAQALGIDIWGFPKLLADVTHENDGTRRKTTVTEDGERVISIEIEPPRSFEKTTTTASYSVRDGVLLRETLELNGEVGMWPYSSKMSYTLGDHPRAERLQELDLGDRALLRFGANAVFTIHQGEPVGKV